MNASLESLSAAGVSIWLDDLSRQRLTDGSLTRLISEKSVVGVTTNPSIFHKAITSGAAEYADQLRECRARGLDASAAVRELTVTDVAAACDEFLDVFHATAGVDGRVSIEVDPRLAHDTAGTVAEARQLHAAVTRPNVLIKIPATKAGLPAITETLGAGISVNVTLIFGVERYREVLAAFAAGLELAEANGHDLSAIHSVASFFVSRVDTAVDARLQGMAGDEAAALLGQAAVANARLAWGAFLEFKDSARWAALADRAHIQRPLWASTGVKNPDYDPAKYVVELVARPSVNTMPEATLEAAAAAAPTVGDTMTEFVNEAADVWHRLEALGISRAEIVSALESAGVQQFIDAWNDLLVAVDTAMKADA